MKSYTRILLILLTAVVCLVSCKKEEEPYLGSVYGTVTDKTTGDNICNAGVELMPLGMKTITGDDGQFEFTNVEEGIYNLYITKTGYKDYKSNDIVVKANADDKPVAIQLEKLPPALTIVDDNRTAIDTLDFGADDGVVMRSFNIFNNGEDKLEWAIVFECDWIKTISKTEGELKANATQSLVITINREKLNLGENITNIHIVSNNGSRQLVVRALCVDVVATLEATDVSGTTAVLNAKLVRDLKPAITEYGFVYSKTAVPSLDNGANKKANIGTPQIGSYALQISGLESLTIYYARAYVSNGKDVHYGNQITFTTISHKPEIRLINTVNIKATATTLTNISYIIDSDGGLPIEEVGICWDTDILPTKNKNFIATDKALTSYKTNLTDLTPNTKYYIRAYVRNSEEYAYSEEYSINTQDGTPTVQTGTEYSYGIDYLTLSGTTTSTDNIPLIRQGICYCATSSMPTIYDSFVTSDNLASSFTCQITGLAGCTSYYYRAFAENEYGIAYGKILTAKTACLPATLKGYIYDQDNNPVANAEVGVGKIDGSFDSKYSAYRSTTNSSGYYEISFPVNSSNTWRILATADNFHYQTKQIVIDAEKEHQLDFTLKLKKTCDVDLGTGQWAEGESRIVFQCSQTSLMGKTTTRNIRLKNYRSVPVSWRFDNLPTQGIKVSQNSGSIPAYGEISIVLTFTYPSTTAQVVALNGCSTANKAYVWNWANVVAGVYPDEQNYMHYDYCTACCEQGVYIYIGDEQGSFMLDFVQFVTYK